MPSRRSNEDLSALGADHGSVPLQGVEGLPCGLAEEAAPPGTPTLVVGAGRGTLRRRRRDRRVDELSAKLG
jgi:hypothetical protein